ncbi:Protein transport protein Sec61 subunit beta, partial [Cucurbita argyrosperma subsp. sororia]
MEMETAVGAILGRLGRHCYAVLCLGVLLLTVAVVHYVGDGEPTDPRERSKRRLRTLHGGRDPPPPRCKGSHLGVFSVCLSFSPQIHLIPIFLSDSQSQSASSSTSRRGVVAPRGSAAATAGLRRRRLGSTSAAGSTGLVGGGSSGGGGGNNMLRFYTDVAPGLKISPTVVLVLSICFIDFITVLHVFGKLYRARSAAGV